MTGMSGTGKSSALEELARRGFRVVETDHSPWSEWIPASGDAEGEWLWREDLIAGLLAEEDERTLYVQGCVRNQGSSTTGSMPSSCSALPLR